MFQPRQATEVCLSKITEDIRSAPQVFIVIIMEYRSGIVFEGLLFYHITLGLQNTDYNQHERFNKYQLLAGQDIEWRQPCRAGGTG